MARNPDVLSGMREPRTVRLEQIRAAADEQPASQPASGVDGVTVYVSRYRRYRVQITAPHTFADPATGRKTTSGTMLVAVFEDGVYRNNHRDPATRALIDDALQSNPYFGKFGSTAHFWLASEQTATMDAAKAKAAFDTLKAMPREAVEQFVASLQPSNDEDHVLPPVEAARGIRPIPAP